MKKLIFLLGMSLSGIVTMAQLANTKWKGSVTTNDPHPVIWDFKKDTVLVIFTDSSESTEVMTFSITADKMVSFTKVSGGSPCDAGATGAYSFVIADDKLRLTAVQEACPARAHTVDNAQFERIK